MLKPEHVITPKDNVLLPIIVDCEWTQFAGKPNDWTLEKLAKNENKFLLQKENIDAVLKKYGFEDCLSLALKQNLPVYELDKLEGIKSVKLKKNTHLTTQFKHVFYDDETILINPEVKSIYEKHVTDKKLHYPSYDVANGCQIIDYMKIQGFDIFLTRRPDIDEDDFKKKYKRAFTVKLYAYWLNADFSKIFHGQYLADLKQAYVDGKITLNRRLIGRGHTARWYPNWLISINDEVYKFQIEFQDMGALQGNIGFDTVLTNLDMNTEKKKLLDGLKNNMGYALLKYPQEFQEYALNDLVVYEMYKKHDKMIEKVYIEMGLENFICESRLTTGAMVNELQEAVLLRYLGYNERSKEGREELKSLTSLASPKHLKEYVDMATKLKNTGYLRRDRLAKVAGGRCYNVSVKYPASNKEKIM